MAALTTANGVNATKFAALAAGTTTIQDFVDGVADQGTGVRVSFDSYTVPTDTIAVAGVITMGKVPKGSRILGFHVTNTAMAAAATADLQIVDSDGNITAMTAAEAWTDMTTAQGLFIPALNAGQTALDEDHTVTVTTAAQVLDATKVITVSTLYIGQDD
jgi:hypothetical protein